MKNSINLIIAVILSLLLSCNKHDFFQLPPFSKVYGGSDVDNGSSIVASEDGGYVLASDSYSNDGDVSGNHGNNDIWLMKVDRNGNITGQKTLGGSGMDDVTSIIRSHDGGYVVVGQTNSKDGDVTGVHESGWSIGDAWVVKVDKNGNIQWQKALGGSGYDYAESVVKSPDGGYVIAGHTTSNDGDLSGKHALGFDAWIVKLDDTGNIVWQKTVGGTSDDLAYGIITAKGGGYVVTGQTLSNDGDISGSHGGFDAMLFKLDENGNLLWLNIYGGTSGENGRSVTAGIDDGYVFAGYTASNDGDASGNHHGSMDAWIVKVDGNGNKLWQKTIGGSGMDQAFSIVTIPNAGYGFTGETTSNDGDVGGNQGSTDAWVVLMDAGGNMVEQRTFGGSELDVATSMIITHGRNYVLGGFTNSNNGDVSGPHGSTDAWIVRGKF